MSDPAVELSVIVVNWNGSSLLHRCLSDLLATIQHTRFEVVVVDNGSEDGSVQMVRRCFPEVQLLTNRGNAGFAKANNQAFEICQGRHLLLLNNDAFVTGRCVEQMLKFLERDPEAGIVGANLSYGDGRWQLSHWPLPNLWLELLSMLGLDKLTARSLHPRPEVETGAVSGACLMIRSHLFAELGRFDPRFHFYSEDVDLCQRVRAAGWKVVHLVNARVIHLGGGGTDLSSGRLLLLYRAKFLYFEKHFGRWQAQALSLSLYCASILKLSVFALGFLLRLCRVQRVTLWWNVLLGFALVRDGHA